MTYQVFITLFASDENGEAYNTEYRFEHRPDAEMLRGLVDEARDEFSAIFDGPPSEGVSLHLSYLDADERDVDPLDPEKAKENYDTSR